MTFNWFEDRRDVSPDTLSVVRYGSFNETVLISFLVRDSRETITVDLDHLEDELRCLRIRILRKVEQERARAYAADQYDSNLLVDEEEDHAETVIETLNDDSEPEPIVEEHSHWIEGTRSPALTVRDNEKLLDADNQVIPTEEYTSGAGLLGFSHPDDATPRNHDTEIEIEDTQYNNSTAHSLKRRSMIVRLFINKERLKSTITDVVALPLHVCDEEPAPSQRTQELYAKWVTDPARINQPLGALEFSKRDSHCYDPVDIDEEGEYYEDLLDLYIFAYFRNLSRLEFEVLRAFQTANFRWSINLPGLALIRKTFDILPLHASLCLYLIDVYAHDWTTTVWIRTENYVPFGKGFEKFLYGIASTRELMLWELADDHFPRGSRGSGREAWAAKNAQGLFEGWCNHHNHASEAEKEGCMKWRDERKRECWGGDKSKSPKKTRKRRRMW